MDVNVDGRRFIYDRPTHSLPRLPADQIADDQYMAVTEIPRQFRTSLEWAEFHAASRLLKLLVVHRLSGVWARTRLATRQSRIYYTTLRAQFILDARKFVSQQPERIQLPPCVRCGAQTLGACPHPMRRAEGFPQVCGKPCCRDCQLDGRTCHACFRGNIFPVPDPILPLIH